MAGVKGRAFLYNIYYCKGPSEQTAKLHGAHNTSSRLVVAVVEIRVFIGPSLLFTHAKLFPASRVKKNKMKNNAPVKTFSVAPRDFPIVHLYIRFLPPTFRGYGLVQLAGRRTPNGRGGCAVAGARRAESTIYWIVSGRYSTYSHFVVSQASKHLNDDF